MDPELLTRSEFWNDPALAVAGDFCGEIAGISNLSGLVIFATSGSSGEPKWIAQSKPALLESAAAVNAHLAVKSSSCWGLALPIYHVGGFGVAARVYASGCRLEIFARRWDARNFHGWLAQRRVTHLSLVPTQVHDLVAANLRAPSGLTAVVIGGGHLDERTGQAARALGWPVLVSYGMTEAGSQIATQGFDDLTATFRSAPLPILPIWQTRTGPDERLEIAGPALFSGVIEKRGNSWSFRPRETEWHVTADRVLLDDRLLTPLGRADLWIKVLGELVDPQAIECELVELSGGRMAAGDFVVIPLPDERAGHRLVPVLDVAAKSDVFAEVMQAYQQHAVGFRRLQDPVWIEDFPRSSLGKPRRAEILKRLM